MDYEYVKLTGQGTRPTISNDRLKMPDQPILGNVEDNDIGPAITAACPRTWNAAQATARGDR